MTDTEAIELDRLQCAFQRLPRLHALIFFAVCHDKLSFAETGKQVGRPTRVVRRVLADACFRLLIDVQEQKQDIAIGPIRRFARTQGLNLRLQCRLWRDRW